MLKFWRNPEFIRHVRAELRPSRALTSAFVALLICLLVGLACWAPERDNIDQFFRTFHGWLVGIQFTVLGFWCASACGQAICRERELKTYDFLRTTRLSAAELMIGKVTGAPIMGYFVVICSLPVSVLAGIWGGFSPFVLLRVYVLLFAFSLFVSLAALALSMLLEKSASAVVALLILLPMTAFYGMAFSPFSGFGGFSILPALFSLYEVNDTSPPIPPTLFGFRTSFFVATLLLYVTFGAWLFLILKRNLKREREQVRLFSRWQAVGFGAFLNLLLYAFLNPGLLSLHPGYRTIQPGTVSAVAMGLNGLFLFLIGLATLTPHERLKVWWRNRLAKKEGYFSESGLPWPWLAAVAAIAFALLVAEALGLKSTFALESWHLGAAALQLLALLVFATRDVLFLQWCNVTSMKRPLVKGVLYLLLYYVAVSIVAGVVGVGSEGAGSFVFQLTTPLGPFLPDLPAPYTRPAIYVGLALQLGLILLVLKAIIGRISRPASVSPSLSST